MELQHEAVSISRSPRKGYKSLFQRICTNYKHTFHAHIYFCAHTNHKVISWYLNIYIYFTLAAHDDNLILPFLGEIIIQIIMVEQKRKRVILFFCRKNWS